MSLNDLDNLVKQGNLFIRRFPTDKVGDFDYSVPSHTELIKVEFDTEQNEIVLVFWAKGFSERELVVVEFQEKILADEQDERMSEHTRASLGIVKAALEYDEEE